MKYLKKFEAIDIAVKIAIYNADKKELICVVDSMKLAARYIYGDDLDSRAPDKIKQKLKTKYTIDTNNSVHAFNIAVRNASLKQIELLGNKKFIFVNGYSNPFKIDNIKI